MKIQRGSYIILFVIGLLLIGLPAACQNEGEGNAAGAPAEEATAIPAVQPAVDAVFAEGALQPLHTIDLSFQTGGRVAEILVAEGETVEAGDPLIRLDTTDAELTLQQAEARLASAQSGLDAAQMELELARAAVTTAQGQVGVAEAQLALTEAGPQPEAVTAAERRLAAAGASLSQAVANRDDTLTIGAEPEIEAARAQVASAKAAREQLAQQYESILDACFETPEGEICPLYGPVEEQTRAQLEAAQQREAAAQAQLDRLLAGPTAAQQRAAGGNVAIAAAQQEQAQAQLDQLLAGATPEQIEQARVGVAQAEVGVSQAEVRVSEAETAVQRAEAAVAAAQVAVDEAELALERLTLQATVAGTVVDVMVDPAQIVAAGNPVLTLADFSGWQVKTTDLTELDVAKVSPGKTVSVGFDAIPEQEVTGTVREIALTPSLSQGDVVYEVTVELEAAPDLPLRWGMTAFVDIDA